LNQKHNLISSVQFFTGSVGDIDIIDIKDIEDLIQVLHISLIIGQPEFKKEGALLKHNFSFDQFKQLNYMHSISLIKLEINEVVNNNQLNLFETYREAIQNEKDERNEEVQNVIDGLFPLEQPNYEEEELDTDDLPF